MKFSCCFLITLIKVCFWVSLVNYQYVLPLTLKSQLDFFTYNKDQDFSNDSKSNIINPNMNTSNQSNLQDSNSIITTNNNQSNDRETLDVNTTSTSPLNLTNMFQSLASLRNDDEGFTSKLGDMMGNISALSTDNKVIVNSSQKNLVATLNVLVKKYLELKEAKRKSDVNNIIQFQNQNKAEHLFNTKTPEIIRDDISYLQKFRFKSIENDLKIKQSKERLQTKMHNKATPYNIIINKPDLVYKNKENLRIDNTLLNKVRLDNSYSENVIGCCLVVHLCL